MPTTKQTEKLARGIVLAQGNDFIKELLRSHKIKIGTTKADFEENLIKAIHSREITHADIEAWLRQVEGWGNQTIYPYRLTKKAASDKIWSSESALQAALKKSGLDIAKLWNADSSLQFPSKPTLTGIYYESGTGVQFVWHQGDEMWKRDTSKDYEKEIDGDRYQFKASRHLAAR